MHRAGIHVRPLLLLALACVVFVVVWSGGLGIKCQCSAVGSLKIYVSETGDDSYSIVEVCPPVQKKRRRSNINRRHQLTDSANRPEISERGLIELLLNVAKILDPMISSTHIPHWTISTHNLFQFFYKKINMLGCMYHESNKNQYVVVHVP
jgi:hypothetical protein